MRKNMEMKELRKKSPEDMERHFHLLKHKKKKAGALIECGMAQGLIDVSANSAVWRMYLQQGELIPPELRTYAPYNYYYLAIRIIKADNLLSFDESGLSNPYVTVSWAGQRLQTSEKKGKLYIISDG